LLCEVVEVEEVRLGKWSMVVVDLDLDCE